MNAYFSCKQIHNFTPSNKTWLGDSCSKTYLSVLIGILLKRPQTFLLSPLNSTTLSTMCFTSVTKPVRPFVLVGLLLRHCYSLTVNIHVSSSPNYTTLRIIHCFFTSVQMYRSPTYKNHISTMFMIMFEIWLQDLSADELKVVLNEWKEMIIFLNAIMTWKNNWFPLCIFCFVTFIYL